MPNKAPRRVVIEQVTPLVDGGRFPAKTIVGDPLVVAADIFADGHDLIAAEVAFGPEDRRERWSTVALEPAGNDRFEATIRLAAPGRHAFVIRGWVDAFSTWAEALKKRQAAGQDVTLELEIGARMVEEAAGRAPEPERADLLSLAGRLRAGEGRETLDESLRARVRALADPEEVTELSPPAIVVADPERAVYGAWYELFPRSLGGSRRHGTFKDVVAQLPYVKELGFDVLYLPPIHPIGMTGRKGKNNRLRARPGDVGSPWAIGSKEGGHTAIHPQLGTFDDFAQLLAAAGRLGLDVAIDLAFQCSPDHPWVHEHPEWFSKLPDGTVRHAENPPKRYEDIYPLDFSCERWESLWQELLDVVLFWIDRGVTIFRVDNPHTKPFAFWEWLLKEVKARCPSAIFLAEAFTRPKVMYRLAKLGFSQSYTYFAWKREGWELRSYFEELTAPPVSWYFRPNLWPNTPDILTAQLREGGRAAFMVRFLLAATLGASYGIYGPVFERIYHRGVGDGTEEYLDSEKYQLGAIPPPEDGADLGGLISTVNAARRAHPSLWRNDTLAFHATDNPLLLAYSKTGPQGDRILCIVNLDVTYPQSGFTQLDLGALSLDGEGPFVVCDLLDGRRYTWRGAQNFVSLEPTVQPAHLFHIEES